MPRILVVDDDVLIREILRKVLQNRGYKIVIAESGHDGVSAIEAFSFDLVLVDIFMPGMDGFETIRTLRASAPEVPVVAMSGYVFGDPAADGDYFLKALGLGVAHCLHKPFRNEELVAVIEACRIGAPATENRVA